MPAKTKQTGSTRKAASGIERPKRKLTLVSFVHRFRVHKTAFRAGAAFVLKQYLLGHKEISDAYDIEIKIFDLDENDEIVLRALNRTNAGIFGFTCYYWTVDKVLSVSRKLKLIWPDSRIIAGGPQVSPELLKSNKWLDFGVVGEGEIPLKNLLIKINSNNTEYKSVKALIRRENGGVVTNPELDPIQDLEGTPMLSECNEFVEMNRDAAENRIPLDTSRGCPYRCSYCSWSWGKVRFFSLDRVEKAIAFMSEGMPGNRKYIIDFTDAYLDISMRRMKDLLEMLEANKRDNVLYRAYFLFNRFDAETVELLERSNFAHLKLGLQATEPGVVEAMNRKWFPANSLDLVLNLQDRFTIYVDLLYGLPGDSYENFRDTLVSIWKRGIDMLCTFRLRVLPAARFGTESERYGIVADPQPPHLVYSARGFSFDDVYRSGRFAQSFRALTRLLKRDGIAFVEKSFGIDIVSMAEEIHEKYPEWDAHLVKASEGDNDCYCDETGASIVFDYIKRFGQKKGNLSALEELLEVRRAEMELEGAFDIKFSRESQNQIADRKSLARENIFLPEYKKVKLKNDIYSLSNRKGAIAKFESAKTFFMMNDFKNETVAAMSFPSPDIAELILRLLSKPILANNAADFVESNVKGLSGKDALAFIEMLCDKSALLFCKQ